MKGRRLSEEERRQREKEEESRRRIQDQAYREAQRAVYARIYQEQDAMPDDYREAFREDDRYYDEPPRRSAPRHYDGYERYDEAERHAARQDRYDTVRLRRKENRKRPVSHPSAPAETTGSKTSAGRRKKRGRRIVLILLLIAAALLLVGMLVHGIFVHRPDAVEEGEGTHPALLEAGRKEDVYTFLLVGRDDGGGGNTDTIMVGCYDVKSGTLDVLSIYRDTLVDVPWEIKKINSVYNNTGLEGLLSEVKDLIGYTPDYYFVMELDMVAQILDAIGGVDYDVPYNMHYDDPTQDLHIHFDAGKQHLNGEDAVKVLRWRKNNSGENLSVGDVGRVEIQHSFLKALAGQALSLRTLAHLDDILDIVDENLDSNLSYGEMLWFGEHVLREGQDAVRFHSLPGDYTGTLWSNTYKNYQSYVFVNDGALLELVNEYMNPYEADITPEMQHVIYGTTVNNMPTGEDYATDVPVE